MKKIKHLYIIGNGFDLCHGLPTNYGHFRDYVKEHDKELSELVEKYYFHKKDSDFWSDFEENLGNFDDDLLREYGLNYLEDYGCENWRDAFHHDYQYELDRIIERIILGLRECFCNWLSQISFDGLKQNAISIERNAYYLTFNYTRTLEKIYDIPTQNILHIHGTIKGHDNDEIIYGHGGHPYITGKDIDDPRVAEGEEIIKDYFEKTTKPVKQIIHRYRKFFYRMIVDVNKVTIVGHSMNEIDYPYFKKIGNSVQGRIEWTYYYHSMNDIDNCLKCLESRLKYNGDKLHFLPYPNN